MSALITVYITNYNYGRYIRQSIESVLAQSLQNFELIIIDDGSSDDSRDIIETYSHHPQINIIYQQNKGLNVTNNIAMRAAQGKYLMRLDADDYLDEDALSLMSQRLEEDDALGLVFPDYYLVDAHGDLIGREHRHSFDTEVTLLDQPAHGACTMVRRQFLIEAGGYDESFSCQDGWDLWIKFTALYKVSNINQPLFYYRQHGNNLTRNENRLLQTRAEMKRVYAEQNLPRLKTVAILPIRSTQTAQGNLALKPLGHKPLVNWLIDAALEANQVDLLVVTSPDEEVGEHLAAHYQYQSGWTFLRRRPEQARLNTDLTQTLQSVLEMEACRSLAPDTLMRLSIEYPFITATNIDDAVHTLGVFAADSVMSVRPETMTFYQHDGHGLKPIMGQENFTRLERDALYKNVGGLTIGRVSNFERTRNLMGNSVGHIVIDEGAAHAVRSEHEMKIAQYLASQMQSCQHALA